MKPIIGNNSVHMPNWHDFCQHILQYYAGCITLGQLERACMHHNHQEIQAIVMDTDRIVVTSSYVNDNNMLHEPEFFIINPHKGRASI